MKRQRRPLKVISPAARKRRYYSVEAAGAQVGLKRSPAYAAAASGEIPTEKHGERLLLVPRAKWDRIVKQLLGGPVRAVAKPRRRHASSSSHEARP